MKITYLFLIFYFGFIISIQSQNPQDGWDFSYPGENNSKEALLDLSYLNEGVAGENGFITRSEDGEYFVNEAGDNIRFWSVNGGSLARDFSNYELEQFAKFLARMGVNMIRYHGSINPKGNLSLITDVDMDEIHNIWRLVTAMKEEGIYTTISPFWAHNGHMGGVVPESWGIEGYSGGDSLWDVIYFSDTLKQGYKSWVEHLYTEKNPYTGIALKDDPAVAMVQVMNEDGLFFWTIQNVKEPIKKIIRQKFYKWLVEKYGSIAEAQSEWGDVRMGNDNSKAGEMDFYQIWFATEDQSGGLDKRLTDQIEFMAQVQRNFYREMYDYYRSLGCKQMINGSNWKTANAARLLDLERWTNDVNEVIAFNRYYSPGHIGQNSGWRIDRGHYYQGESLMNYPHRLPINAKQPVGHPIVVTESGWNLPHKYQSEGPFLISAYMSLSGVDGFYWFNPSATQYDKTPYHTWTHLEGGQHPLSRWTASIPGQMAMFPANSLLYRKAYLKEGRTVVQENRNLESMWQRNLPVITENMGFDPNRDTQIDTIENTDLSPLSYLIGPVKVGFDTVGTSSVNTEDLDSFIDYRNNRVKSITGELEWDYENGICKMDSPSAQGVCGFVGKVEEIELSDVIIETTNTYSAINVVSMDENPLSSSGKILIQVGTVYRPTGWEETATQFENNGETVAGYRIDNTGRMPWKAANTEVTVRIKNQGISKATLLDEAGYASVSIDISEEGEYKVITLPHNAMHVVLEGTKTNNSESSGQRGMKVFPNPSGGVFNVQLDRNDFQNVELEVQEITGEKVWENKAMTSSNMQIDLEGPQGVKLLIMKKDNVIVDMKKVIIIK